MKEEYLIQACTGKRVDVFKGQTITVIDVSGGQVADFFAESVRTIRKDSRRDGQTGDRFCPPGIDAGTEGCLFF